MPFNAVYHVAALNHWQDVVREQIPILLGNATLKGLVMTVATSSDEQARVARAIVKNLIGQCRRTVRFQLLTCPLQGFEHPALDILDQVAAKEADPVLYFHAKAVSYSPPNEFHERWRRYLNEFVGEADRWADFLATSTFDTCGRLLLADHQNQGFRYFAGNFWMAKASYLRQLPGYQSWAKSKDPALDRHLAELAVDRSQLMIPYVTDGAVLNIPTWYPHLQSVLSGAPARALANRAPPG